VKAFTRLQEEIIKKSDDLSLFAWYSKNTTRRLGGILAESPRQFALTSGRRHPDGPEIVTAATSQNFSITNKGLRITTELLEYPPDADILSTASFLRTANMYCL